MKLIWHNYLVLNLSNCVPETPTETSLSGHTWSHKSRPVAQFTHHNLIHPARIRHLGRDWFADGNSLARMPRTGPAVARLARC